MTPETAGSASSCSSSRVGVLRHRHRHHRVRPKRPGTPAPISATTYVSRRPAGPVTTSRGAGPVAAGLEALEAPTSSSPGMHAGPCRRQAAALDALAAAHARGTRVMSVCTGAFVLAHAGLLDGRRATTHWAFAEQLAGSSRRSVDPDILYVDDGDVLTSAGLSAGLDLCLHVVRGDRGADAATTIARWNVVAPHRDGGQAQYIDRPVPWRATTAASPRRGRGPSSASTRRSPSKCSPATRT